MLLTTAAGCGPSTGASGGSTHVAIQGNPASARKCTMTLLMEHPIQRQLTASLIITCNFVVATADVSLVIQGRPAGGNDTQWDNVDSPKTSNEVPPMSLRYTIPCITGLEYQASAAIDALAGDGAPISSSETTTPRSYSAAECA